MKYTVLATDYDGTIAHDGVVDEATLDALQRARAAGLRLVMVTGRELTSLFNTFAGCAVFDKIVAENGAVVHDPQKESIERLAEGPPPEFLQRLERAQVPISVGHSIVATVTPHDREMLEAIHTLGLPWHVIYNKGAAMALPLEVTKATGLAAVLKIIGVEAAEVVGVGDAENDYAFLRYCGLSVAVSNALPEVKDVVDVVTAGARGTGVTELIGRLLSGELDAIVPNPAHHVPVLA
ncbi:MAG TPA: HAD family hydrolase [Vicinamibacterales bacterium]|nr:HAD family hydrolase [Vicinamibacterales bacterium]